MEYIFIKYKKLNFYNGDEKRAFFCTVRTLNCCTEKRSFLYSTEKSFFFVLGQKRDFFFVLVQKTALFCTLIEKARKLKCNMVVSQMVKNDRLQRQIIIQTLSNRVGLLSRA
jgi:hypothetical protein